LWSIASKLDVGNAGINVFQIMIALLRENPDAFVNFNINRLRVGRILKLDNIETVAKITKQEASTVYTAHLDEWQAYRLQIAQASQTAMVPAATTEEPPSTDAADAVRTSAEREGMTQQAVAEEAKPDEIPVQAAEATQAGAMEKDVLRIVRANIDKTEESTGQTAGNEAAAAEAQVLNDQIRLLEETLTSRERENKELRERVASLESQVEKTSRLIQLQSEQMAQMQQALAKPPTPAEPPAPAAAVATEEKAMVQEVAKAEVKPPVKPVEQPEAKAAAAAPKVADKPKQPAAKPKPKTTTKVTAEPKKSDPWWQGVLDSLFSSWQYLVGLGVAAVALLVGLLQVFRRRRSIAEFEESILTGSVLDGQTETTTDTTRATGATDTSFLSDFGMAGMGTVQADQVDPLAESEVYLAYGRDEQAEEVLKEAIKKDSGRYELKLKLLEIYQQRNDLKAFETLAEELYPAGDQGDPVIWQQVVAMGRNMNPHNPLFSQEIPAVAAAGADQQSAEDLALGTSSSAEVSMDGSLQPFPEPDDGARLEAELDALRDDDGVQRQPEQEVATGGDESAAPEPAARTEELSEAIMQTANSDVTEEKAVDELDDVDFDLDFEALEAEAQQQTESEVVQQLAEGLDFDVSPAPDNESVEEAEQRAANVMPLPGNTTAASAPTVEMTLDPSASETLSQPAQYSLSADLDELPTAGVVEAAAAVPDAPDEEIKLNLEELAATVSDMDGVEPAGAEPEQWDEAATKLDLARAYIDMGDKDGARSIIDEVLKQGNPTQRTQAQELANQLSG
jgi:pilus assembly protein FimV